jgi:hypothetical protein
VAAISDEWRVLSNDPVVQLEENLWRVEGSLPGMPLRRVMTFARRTDGGLVIHNAMALDDAGMRKLEAAGEPTLLVVPSGYHRLDAPAYKKRYPQIEVVCPAAARKKVEQVVPVDYTYTDVPNDPDVTLRHIAGAKEGEGVMIVRHGDASSLVLNDLVFNMPHTGGLTGWVLRWLMGSTGGPKVTRLGRWVLVGDKRAFADDLRALAATPGLRRVIVSHHETIDQDAPGVLRAIAATLSEPAALPAS